MPFNLRVYGLVLNASGEILLSEERRGGFEFCKFPGGGVQAGEGILDALHREFREELDAEIVDAQFFYFNDFYQPSAFNPRQQVVCFYYLVTIKHPEQLTINSKNLPLDGEPGDYERFFWMAKETVKQEMLTFPIDQKVLHKINLTLK